jgi:hypothetical protein
MSDVPTLLSQYMEELGSGKRPDAAAFIERAETQDERIELAQSIEVALAFATDEARHPRDAATGKLDPATVAAISNVISDEQDWSAQIAAAREASGRSVEDVARATLDEGGLLADETNVTTASKWIEAIEAGRKGLKDLSDAAADALSRVLSPDPSTPADAAPAFRTKASVDEEFIFELNAMAGDFADRLAPTDAESWFEPDDQL